MKAYYNEIDPYCVAWLRNLIAEKLIPDGDVDDRSIADVRPIDVKGYTQCHWFAGLGGWGGALRLAGWPDHREVWTGSCPCQPFSLAGKQGGFADERHLWPFFGYHIKVCRPAVVFGEQVASASQWLRLVRGDLEAMGYAVGAIPVEAASASADHLRDRYWFVADSAQQRFNGCGETRPSRRDEPANGGFFLADANDAGSQGRGLLPERAGERVAEADGVADADRNASGAGRRNAGEVRCVSEAQREPEHGPALSGGSSDELDWVIGADGKARRVKPGICLLAHGVPNRVAKLRAFGNAIDLRPAAAFIQATQSALAFHPQNPSS